jgi:predicted flap endonuclease-1-like 5' DNA nuclease
VRLSPSIIRSSSILPFSLGPIHFFAFDLLGAILWGVNAVILIWVVNSLWNLRMEGWLFVVVIAVFNLILAFLSVIGQSSFSAMLPAILINAIILIYCLTPNVSEAFKQVKKPAPAVVTPEAVRAAMAETPAPAKPAMPAEEKMAPIPEQVETAGPPAIEAPILPSEEVPVEPETAAISTPSPQSQEDEIAIPAPIARPKVPVETIEGIGPVYAARLKEIGILFVADLLEAGASRRGREELVEKVGISATLVLKWVNMADLMRISGIGEEYSELLEAAGVDTVKELRNRIPENLHQAMLQANLQRKMVRRTPHLSEVQSWVEQAKHLEPVMTY